MTITVAAERGCDCRVRFASIIADKVCTSSVLKLLDWFSHDHKINMTEELELYVDAMGIKMVWYSFSFSIPSIFSWHFTNLSLILLMRKLQQMLEKDIYVYTKNENRYSVKFVKLDLNSWCEFRTEIMMCGKGNVQLFRGFTCVLHGQI